MALVLIPLAPLIAFVILITRGRQLGARSAWVAIGAMSLSTLCACLVWGALLTGSTPSIEGMWLFLGNRVLTIGLRADPLSGIMLSVVTIIGTLIQIYAVGYMAGDPRYSRFFAYLSLFCAAMLGLVLADNFLLLFMCWELVGVCSYFLISFWFEQPAAAAAGKKAFLTTRVGDVGLLLAMLGLYATTGHVGFAELHHTAVILPSGALTLITLGIVAGAAGKSAQFPLHVWLPDAMEGPTAVSALIHAATMVAAGVYLVARTFPLFEVADTSRFIVAMLGTVTALFAATIACVMTDIKRVLAYSTISQLGLMMAALGVGSSVAAMFHLTTHAWFKALLFLGAGSVIHAVHTQDLRAMGGLRHAMPITCVTMFVGVWAISGIPPLSGFWSKESILAAAWAATPWIAWVLVLTSALTAFYMARWFVLAFLGTPRGARHAHEAPRTMTLPLIVLSIGAAGAGLLGSPVTHNWFATWLIPAHHVADAHAIQHAPAWLAIVTTLLAAGAVVLAVCRYTTLRPRLSPAWQQRVAPILHIVWNKYYIDELYAIMLVRPLCALTRVLDAGDRQVIDRLVDLTGLGSVRISRWKASFDRVVVDGCVNGVGAIAAWCGRCGRQLHTGVVQHYLFAVAASTAAMVWYMFGVGR